jgi:hypothetical protein
MVVDLDIIEKKITDFWTEFFRRLLFFLKDDQKALFVSFLHYAIFIVGFTYFFLYSTPGDIYRLIFFILVLLGALSYFIFNKCFFTSIELQLSDKKNRIQTIIDKYFGKEIEGNKMSKTVLSLSSIILGSILLCKDYNLFDNII